MADHIQKVILLPHHLHQFFGFVTQTLIAMLQFIQQLGLVGHIHYRKNDNRCFGFAINVQANLYRNFMPSFVMGGKIFLPGTQTSTLKVRLSRLKRLG